jgi:hypothetical protein
MRKRKEKKYCKKKKEDDSYRRGIRSFNGREENRVSSIKKRKSSSQRVWKFLL